MTPHDLELKMQHDILRKLMEAGEKLIELQEILERYFARNNEKD